MVEEELVYSGLIEMQELDAPGSTPPRRASTDPHPNLHKVVSLICTPSTTYPFIISKHTGMMVSQVADEVFYTGLIKMQELDAPG